MSEADSNFDFLFKSSSKIADSSLRVRTKSSVQSLMNVMAAAAIWRIPFDVQVIAVLLRISRRGARIQIGKLVAQGVFCIHGNKNSYEFSNENHKKTIFQLLSASQRIELHHRAATFYSKICSANPRLIPSLTFHQLASGRKVARCEALAAIRQSIDSADDVLASLILDAYEDNDMLSLEKDAFRMEIAFARGDFRTVRIYMRKYKSSSDFTEETQLRLLHIRFQLLKNEHPSSHLLNGLTRFLSEPMRSNSVQLIGNLILASFLLDIRAYHSVNLLLVRLDSMLAKFPFPWLSTELTDIRIRYYIDTGELSYAFTLLGERLKMERMGWRRGNLAGLMQLLSLLHHLNAETSKGIRTSQYALRLIEDVQRPLIEYEIRMVRVKIFCDEGLLLQADSELCRIEQLMLSLPLICRSVIIVFRYIIRSRLYGDQADFSDWFNIAFSVVKYAWPAFRRLLMEIIIPLFWEQRIDCASLRPSLDSLRTSQTQTLPDPLVTMIEFYLDTRCVSSETSPSFSKLISSQTSNWKDAGVDVICRSLSALVSSTPKETPDQIIEIIQNLNHPDTRHLAIDALAIWGIRLTAPTSQYPRDRMREMFLVRAHALAMRLKDSGRIKRSEIALGRSLTFNPISSGVAHLAGSAELDELLSCKSRPEIVRYLRNVGNKCFSSQSGAIFEVSPESSTILHQWGNRVDVAVQKSVIRNLSVMHRKAEIIKILSADTIGAVFYTMNSRFTGFYFADCDPSRLSISADTRFERTISLLGLFWAQFQKEVADRPASNLVTDDSTPRDRLIGKSRAIHLLKQTLRQIEHSESTIHLFGETGTGKELVANIIHATSSRSHKPFIAFNCGALPENLIESELFGHIKGAFTGAETQRAGLFASADGGTIFLDEIAELTQSMQVKLLRVLQERKVRSLGSDRERPIDVRVISATNRSLMDEVRAGHFRLDLFYRLVVLELHVPALRDRSEDIEYLAHFFLNRISSKTGIPYKGFSKESIMVMCDYEWPGNVRELENVVEAAANFTDSDDIIQSKTIAPFLRGSPVRDDRSLAEVVSDAERQHILKTLVSTGWNHTLAAKRLGITRQGLFKKTKRYAIIQKGRLKNAHRSH